MIKDYSRYEESTRPLITLGAILAGVAVALGAFGAHALKGRLGGEALGWWETAVQYQMWHALAVLAIGLSGVARLRLPALLFAGGAIVFSGQPVRDGAWRAAVVWSGYPAGWRGDDRGMGIAGLAELDVESVRFSPPFVE